MAALGQNWQSETTARAVQQLPRVLDLRGVAGKELGILQRRLHGGQGDAVDVERQRDGAHGVERLRLADDDADAQAGEAIRLRERSSEEDVRVSRELRQKRRASELDVGLVDEHHRVGRCLADAGEVGRWR